jgi:ankyrin repeat protein
MKATPIATPKALQPAHAAAILTIAAMLTAVGCSRQAESDTPSPSTPVPDAAQPVAQKAQPATDKAFFEAAFAGELDPIINGLRNGVDANARNAEAQTALMLACFNGHSHVGAALLAAGARVDERDPTGRTALMYAATSPDVATVELLLSRQADVNAVDSHERWSPLMFAATEGHLPVLRCLLKHGADPTATDDDGDTPVSFARKAGHTAVVALLTEPAPSR